MTKSGSAKRKSERDKKIPEKAHRKMAMSKTATQLNVDVVVVGSEC